MLQLAIVKKTIKWSYAQITYGSVRKFNHFFLSPRSTGTSTGTGPVPFHTVIELSDGSGAQSHQIAKKNNILTYGRQAPWPPCQGCVWQLVDTSRIKRTRNIKIGRMVAHPTGNNVHQFQGQRSRSPGRIMLRPKLRHILRTERPKWIHHHAC